MPLTYNDQGPTGPAMRVALVTPHDSALLPAVTRAVSFAAAGALAVVLDDTDSTVVVIPSGALAAGVMHPLRVKRINSTGTAATGIVAYW